MTNVVHPLEKCELWSGGFALTSLGARIRGWGMPKLGSHGDGPWVAGGAVRRAVLGEPLGDDVDFFFQCEQQFDDFLAELMTREDRPSVREDRRNAIKLWIPQGSSGFTAELIRGSYFANVDALFRDFDFTCCQFAVNQHYLYCGELAMLDAGQRLLRVNNRQKMATSYAHMIRYLKDGWKLREELVDIFVHDLTTIPNIKLVAADYSGP